MLTYSADELCTLCHHRPPTRIVRKAIFSAALLWWPRAARESADMTDVNSASADRDRWLRIGWLNVRSLSKKTVAVREAIESNNLDVLALTETSASETRLHQTLPWSTLFANHSPATEGSLCHIVDYCDVIM